MLQKCFYERRKNQVRSRTFNYCVSQKRAQIESLVIYRKSNLKKHNNISLKGILSLCLRDSGLLENTIFGWVMIQTPVKFPTSGYELKIELGAFKEKQILCKTF